MRHASVIVWILAVGILCGMYVPPSDRGYPSSHVPVYMSWTELRSAVKSESPRPIRKRGKIYTLGHLLFVNEPNQGVHVFDNRDPAAPKALAFLRIPGNVDIAARGETLFADSFVDLVALDISALPEIRVASRQVDVFPYDPLQVAEGDVYYNPQDVDRNKGVIIAWNRRGK